MSECVPSRAKPRERILDTARHLFRQCGIRGIGVDAIAETAGTNKMTLYRHFGSKDELVVACLHQAATDAEAMWGELADACPGNAMRQLHAWVSRVSDCVLTSRRGCEIANAAVELPEAEQATRSFIEGFKTAQRNRLAALCRSAGIGEADLLADTLSLLLEGARVSRQTVGGAGPSRHFVTMAEAVIRSFATERSSRKVDAEA